MSSYIINGAFVILFIAVGVAYWKFCYNEGRKYNDSIGGLLKELEPYKLAGYERCCQSFYDIDNLFRRNPYVKQPWTEYRNTLTHDDRSGAVYSTREAGEYFSFGALTKVINIAFWQNLGGIFTGLGILGTFFGLTVGLYGIDMENNLGEGIKGLIGGTGAAFFTSLVGIVCALGFNYFHNKIMTGMQGNTENLVESIEALYKRKNTEAWLLDIFKESERQGESLRTFSSDLAMALGDKLNDHMDQSLQRLLEDLRPLFVGLQESIATLSEVLSREMNEGSQRLMEDLRLLFAGLQKGVVDLGEVLNQGLNDSSQQMLANLQPLFVELRESVTSLREVLSREMNEGSRQLIDNLQPLFMGLQKGVVDLGEVLNQGLNDGSRQMLANLQPLFTELQGSIDTLSSSGAKKVGEAINESIGAELNDFSKALTEIQGNMRESMRQSQEAAESTNRKIGELMNKFIEEIDSAAARTSEAQEKSQAAAKETMENLQQAMKEFAGELTQNVAELTKNIAENFAKATNEAMLAQQMEMTRILGEMRDLLQESQQSAKETGDKVIGDLTEATEKIRTAAVDSADRQKQSMDEVCGNLKEVLAEVGNNVKTVAGEMTSAISTANTTLKDTMGGIQGKAEKIADTFSEGAERQMGIMERATEIMSSRFARVSGNMQSILSNYNAAMANINEELEKAHDKLRVTIDSAGEAAKTFKAAAAPVSEAIGNLERQSEVAAEASEEMSDQLKNLIELVSDNEEKFDQQLESLESIREACETEKKGLDGVSRELYATFEKLIKGTNEYNKLMSKDLEATLKKYEKLIKEGMDFLGNGVGDLAETIEDLRRELSRH